MSKKTDKISEQDRLLEIQFKLKDKTRVLDILTVVTLMLICFGYFIITPIWPDRDFSPEENRKLQQMPELTLESLLTDVEEDKFINNIAKYYSDQLPGRNLFVGLKGISEMALMKKENNDVTAAADGYIITRADYPLKPSISDPEKNVVEQNLDGVYALAPALKNLGIPYSIALAGRPEDALQRYLPALYPTEHSENLVGFMNESLTAHSSDIEYIDLLTPLKAMIDDDNNEHQIYYRTDHHWTTYGAYFGYCEIMKAWGIEPQPMENFTIETAAEEFYGTTWRSAGMKWIKPDEIVFFRYDGDETDYTTEIKDAGVARSFAGFYDRSYLAEDVMDKYSSFIGGNNGLVYVTKTNLAEGETREKLVLIKDSYSHSMISFLAYHYDLIIVDLRYYNSPLIKLIDEEQPARVLILNYMGSFTENNVFGIVNMGLKPYLKPAE